MEEHTVTLSLPDGLLKPGERLEYRLPKRGDRYLAKENIRFVVKTAKYDFCFVEHLVIIPAYQWPAGCEAMALKRRTGCDGVVVETATFYQWVPDSVFQALTGCDPPPPGVRVVNPELREEE